MSLSRFAPGNSHPAQATDAQNWMIVRHEVARVE